MKKFLLATSALVAFAGAAQAADKSPIEVTAGGYVDFEAALFHEADNSTTLSRRAGDFATEYGLNFAAEGKAAGGVEYGAMIALNNRMNPSEQIQMDQAYVWMSGKFGKVLMGDTHGVTDLFVMAPTVGEGQIDGNYTHFTDSSTLAQFQPAYFDALENATKIVYYTPKVGNANHKVQLGVSYTPDYNGGNGLDVAKYRSDIGGYADVIEASMQYTGNFSPVNVVVAPIAAFGNGDKNSDMSGIANAPSPSTGFKDFAAYGLGAQAMYAGFTLGGSYLDAGHLGQMKDSGESKEQDVWTVGLKYGFDKVAVAANYMDGRGYYNLADPTNTATTNSVYVDDFSAIGLGATYTWFPGLTSAADAVFFDQNRADTGHNNTGHVLMLSQKMAF